MERVNLLYSRSLYEIRNDNMSKEKIVLLHNCDYHNQRPYMSKEEGNGFIYPCVYITCKDGSKQVWYSNIKKGHFGTPKVIFSNGRSSAPIIDELGEYGLTQFAYGIVDDVEKLPHIQKALSNPEFLKLISFADSGVHRYNPKVIALFRKDFWKEFI